MAMMRVLWGMGLLVAIPCTPLMEEGMVMLGCILHPLLTIHCRNAPIFYSYI